MQRRTFLRNASAAAAVGAAAPLLAQRQKSDSMLDAMPDYSTTGAKLLTGSTPKADGFYFPAEWENHEFTIMVMPPPQNWKGYGIPLEEVRRQWANVANALAEHEHVLMVVRPEDQKKAKRVLDGEIELIEIPVNDGWSRDSGPMFVIDGKGNRRVAGFTFNGWGAKFPPFQDDGLLKAKLCEHLSTPMYPIDFVLEGGAVSVDGEGTLITTEQCLLHETRNTKHNKSAIEKILGDALGIEKVIWLGKGLEPDPVTDGHVDGICAFRRRCERDASYN